MTSTRPAALRASQTGYTAETAAPAYEYADDYSTWVRERADHAQRQREAQAFVAGLVNAAFVLNVKCEPHGPTRAEYEYHKLAVGMFADYVRKKRATSLRWAPQSIFFGWLKSYSISWGEIARELGDDCAWCGERKVDSLHPEGVCVACLDAQERIEEHCSEVSP